jgi:hypothetical protein
MSLALVRGMSNERDETMTCLDCGEPVSPSTDRMYAVGCEDVLCMACCLARGGVYDEDADRWTVPPKIDDLLRSVEIHAH